MAFWLLTFVISFSFAHILTHDLLFINNNFCLFFELCVWPIVAGEVYLIFGQLAIVEFKISCLIIIL